MSEKSASCGEQSVDRLLAEAGLEEAYEIRDELLELRALANSRPRPSAEVQALMAPARVTASPRLAAAPVDDAALLDNAAPAHEAALIDEAVPAHEAAPTDELAARRRKKGRLTFAAVAVAASLAAGGTAAAASEGGIPGTVEHLGAVVGSVVSQLTPGIGWQGSATAGNPPGAGSDAHP
ncbi:hypothetical protein [Arthrobacter sp. NA-172]|uniref:hypothetical protein n=1 Tax=Arthrobacter sp. NA-172 TaxID=3367524 RepID=UPI003755083D